MLVYQTVVFLVGKPSVLFPIRMAKRVWCKSIFPSHPDYHGQGGFHVSTCHLSTISPVLLNGQIVHCPSHAPWFIVYLCGICVDVCVCMVWYGMVWYVCMYVCMYVCVCMYVYHIHLYVCYYYRYVYMHTHTHIYIYLSIYTHVQMWQTNLTPPSKSAPRMMAAWAFGPEKIRMMVGANYNGNVTRM